MSLPNNPKVSIIIPVYNGSNFIRDAIDSALSQSYSNIEVIVVNDGSQDNGATESIARSYGDKIRYFSKPNGGVSTALNLGIEKMTGDYFSWLSHDDLYKPEKIESQLQFLSSCDTYDTILYSGYELISEKAKIIDVIDFTKLFSLNKLNIPLFPVFNGLANGCTMLIHRSHFNRNGLFNENLRTTQDYDLWFKMFRKAKVKFFPGIYVQSRVHPNQTGRINNQHTEECEKLWISMLNEVTDEEMCIMEGSAYQFYIKVADFLKKNTFYVAAQKHASELAEKEVLLNRAKPAFKRNGGIIPFSVSRGSSLKLVQRFFYNVKYEGVKVTFRKIIRKLF
ncbi:glycosyltransferase [Paenibacillus elgii]